MGNDQGVPRQSLRWDQELERPLALSGVPLGLASPMSPAHQEFQDQLLLQDQSLNEKTY